jgi:hypothetical protein
VQGCGLHMLNQRREVEGFDFGLSAGFRDGGEGGREACEQRVGTFG